MPISRSNLLLHAGAGAGLALVLASCAPAVVHVPCVAAPTGFVIPDEKWTPYDRCPPPVAVVRPSVPAGSAGGGAGPAPTPDPGPRPEGGLQYSQTGDGLAVGVENEEFSQAGGGNAVAFDGENRIEANAR